MAKETIEIVNAAKAVDNRVSANLPWFARLVRLPGFLTISTITAFTIDRFITGGYLLWGIVGGMAIGFPIMAFMRRKGRSR